MVHTFLESPSNLDVHPRIRFSIFEKISPELASKSTLYGYVMLTKGSIALRLRANYWSYSNDLYIFWKPNRPRCASQEEFCPFGQNRRNWRRRSRHPKQRNLLMWPGQTRFESCWWHFFCSFFNILVCKALFIASRAQFPRNRAKLTYKSVKYRHCLFLCKDPGGVHCVTFAAIPITAQLWFIHFWKA